MDGNGQASARVTEERHREMRPPDVTFTLLRVLEHTFTFILVKTSSLLPHVFPAILLNAIRLSSKSGRPSSTHSLYSAWRTLSVARRMRFSSSRNTLPSTELYNKTDFSLASHLRRYYHMRIRLLSNTDSRHPGVPITSGGQRGRLGCGV